MKPELAGAGGQLHFAFEHEIAKLLLRDQKELLLAGEMNLAIDDFGLAPFVRILPTRKDPCR